LTLEYKCEISSPLKAAKLLTAFSNSRGGWILVGVDDRGEVIGVRNLKLQKEYLASAARTLCDPPVTPRVETVSVDGRKVLVVHVKESPNKPHRCFIRGDRTEVYIRVRDRNSPAGKPLVRDLINRPEPRRRGSARSADKESFVLSYLEDHESMTVEELSLMLNISRRRAHRILHSLRKSGKILLHLQQKQECYTLA